MIGSGAASLVRRGAGTVDRACSVATQVVL
jgi:hypothetical protein